MATKAKVKAKTTGKRPKKLPVCTAKDLKKKKSKRRRCRVVKPTKKTVAATPVRHSPTGPIAAPPAATPSPDAFPTPPATGGSQPTDGLRSYAGTFGAAQASRLLFRAGFGPTPGQADQLAALGVEGAVDALMNAGGSAQLTGPAPSGTFLVDGQLAPADRYGHLHLAMLDRQVRSTDSLGERMTLVLHDWFAVSMASVDYDLVVDHIALLRNNWRGSFRDLLLAITRDPAMLAFLNGIDNTKSAPNENYAREVMELFALGADRGAYTETDVREMARAFTGFRADWNATQGLNNFRFDATRFDTGVKTVFGGTTAERTGRLGWQDAVNAVVDHPMHASFVVLKLWSYFIPTAPTPVTQAQLEALYRRGGEQLGPVVRAILVHPDLHAGPAMVKPPVVYVSGLLRSRAASITTDAWVYRSDSAGQLLGFPPNVAGWNDRAWLNTSSHSARWGVVQQFLNSAYLRSADYTGKTETPEQAVASALGAWGNPTLAPDQLAALGNVAQESWVPRTVGDQYGSLANFLANRQNVLRLMVAAAPDFQVS